MPKSELKSRQYPIVNEGGIKITLRQLPESAAQR